MRIHVWAIRLFPHQRAKAIRIPENGIKYEFGTMNFVAIQSNPYGALVRKKIIKQMKARPHHQAPIVMAQAVLYADRSWRFQV